MTPMMILGAGSQGGGSSQSVGAHDTRGKCRAEWQFADRLELTRVTRGRRADESTTAGSGGGGER